MCGFHTAHRMVGARTQVEALPPLAAAARRMPTQKRNDGTNAAYAQQIVVSDYI